MNKSISELAKELNVSRQAIYQRIKNDKDLSTSLQPFTVNECKRTVYSLQGQELIKQAFSAHCKQEVDSSLQSIDSKPIDTNCKPVDSSLQSELDILRASNDGLQAQVEELRADKAFLKEQLTIKDKQIEALTTALQAAQALQGMEKQKQQKVIEVKQPAAVKDPTPARSEKHPQEARPSHSTGRTGTLSRILQDIKRRLH